jgi:uncharacterized membrane protein YecN with MAPEG domain
VDNGTLFYICGSVLAVSAAVVALLGLRVARFPGRLAPVVAVWFVALIVASTTFAVLHSQDEEVHHEEEVGLPQATEEAEAEEAE